MIPQWLKCMFGRHVRGELRVNTTHGITEIARLCKSCRCWMDADPFTRHEVWDAQE